MPSYTVRDPESGRTVTISGDSPPTPDELEQVFASLTKQAPAPKAVPTATPIPAPNRDQQPWELAMGNDMPADARGPLLNQEQGRSVAGSARSIALEGGGAEVGQMVGAVPVLSVPTAGLSVPALRFAGGVAGSVAAQKLEGNEKISWGRALGNGIAGLFPGAALKGAATKTVAKEGVKQAATNLAATSAETILDQKRLPTVREASIAAGAAVPGVLMARGVDSVSPTTTQKQINNTSRDITLELARQNNLKIKPSDLSDAPVVAQALEVLGGASKTKAEREAISFAAYLAIARKAIGLPADAVIDFASVSAQRKELEKVYKQVASASGRSMAALEKFKEAGANKRAMFRAIQESKTGLGPEARREAENWAKKEEVYRRVIDSELRRTNKQDLIDAFDDARVKIAKSYVIEDAFSEGSGAVAGNIIQRRMAFYKKENG